MSEDRLQAIFESKRKSSTAFRMVQHKLGAFLDETLIETADWRSRSGAIELHKGLHWINLELAEFIGAGDRTSQEEELADVMHFLVEFCLLCGYTHEIIKEDPAVGIDRLEVILNASKEDPFVFNDPHQNARFAILSALRVADMIKNKPWKQTLKVERDESEFEFRVRGIWYWYGATLRTLGMNAQGIRDEFFKKEAINYRRIESGV